MKNTHTLLLIIIFVVTACTTEEDANRAVGELTSMRIEMTAEFAEPIVGIDVAEGEAVVAGQVLLQQDNARARARYAEAEAFLLQATARRDELTRGPRQEQIAAARADVEGATRALAFRSSESNRIRDIHDRGLTSADALDKAVAALDSASATLKVRRAQLEEMLAGTTVEELTQAEQFVEQAAAKRDSARIDLERHTFIAPVDGIVDSRVFELGERPGIGQPVIVMLGGDQAYARVYVSEKTRVRVHSGSKATLYIDGLEKSVAGRVRWIASEATFTPYFALTERDRGRLSYIAKVDITDSLRRLPDGVPVEVEFELDQ